MNIIHAFIFSISLLCSLATTAKETKILQKDMALKYIVKEPSVKTSTTPLIILLHGYGSNEADLFSLTKELPQEAIVVAVRAPIKLANGYAWFPVARFGDKEDPAAPERSRQLMLQFIDQAAKKYRIPAARIYLVGFSQGAMMSLNIALTQPERVHGIAMLSGKLIEETKNKMVKPELINKVSIFEAHGTEDQVIPIATGREAHAYLTIKNIKTEYHEYKMVHTISMEELLDIKKWFASNLKK